MVVGLVTTILCLLYGAVPNGGFESGTSNWSANGGTVSMVSDSYTGTKALSVVPSPALGYGLANSSPVAVTAGEKYRVKGFAKRVNGSVSDPFMIAVQWFDSSSSLISVSNSWSGDSIWSGYSFHGGTFVAPSGSSSAIITLGAWGSTTYYFDDISLEHRPFEIWYAPTFYQDPDEIFATNDWELAKSDLDVYKFYKRQFLKNDPLRCSKKFFDIAKVVRALDNSGTDIAIELAGPFEYEPWFASGVGVASANADLVQINQVYAAGGTVKYLSMDCPVSRLLRGARYSYYAPTGALGAMTDDLSEIVDEIRSYYATIHAAYPDIEIGMIVNFPNWRMNGLSGTGAPWSNNTGLEYQDVLSAVAAGLSLDGKSLAFLQVDNPYNFYSSTDYLRWIALKKQCDSLGIPFQAILNTYVLGACTGSNPCLDLDCPTGSQDAQSFYAQTMALTGYMFQHGIVPSGYCVQSWYEYPFHQTPETASGSFMNLAKDVAALVKTSQPAPLINSGYENGTANWATLAGSTSVSTTSILGAKAITINALLTPIFGHIGAIRSDAVSVQPNTSYTLCYYSKRLTTGNMTAYLVWYDQNGVALRTDSAAGPTSPVYSLGSVTRTSPINAAYVKVQFNVFGVSSAFLADNVFLIGS